MFNEINIIDLLNACTVAQQKANAPGKTQIIKVNDFSKKTGGRNKDNNAHYTYGR
jgi:chitodextrinase